MGEKFGKLDFVKADKSDIGEIVRLNQLNMLKFGGLLLWYLKDFFQLEAKIGLQIDQYEAIMSGNRKLGYIYWYKDGNDMVIEDFQLYSPYHCEEVVFQVIFYGRGQLSNTGDRLFIKNVNMCDEKRLSLYQRDDMRHYKTIGPKKAVMVWFWSHMWWR